MGLISHEAEEGKGLSPQSQCGMKRERERDCLFLIKGMSTQLLCRLNFLELNPTWSFADVGSQPQYNV